MVSSVNIYIFLIQNKYFKIEERLKDLDRKYYIIIVFICSEETKVKKINSNEQQHSKNNSPAH